jgi:hypothetical protein
MALIITALVESNPYNLMSAAHRAKIAEHPACVVRVVPHPNSESGHLDIYDILDQDLNASTPVSPSSLLSRALSTALAIPKQLGGVLLITVILSVVVTIVLPVSTCGVALQSRYTQADLTRLGVIRRNAKSLEKWFELTAPLNTDMPWNKMRKVLDEQAPFSRVDVYLAGPNTHGTIIARNRSPMKHQGEIVMDYVFAKCLL